MKLVRFVGFISSSSSDPLEALELPAGEIAVGAG